VLGSKAADDSGAIEALVALFVCGVAGSGARDEQ
jgi:hypothetical protein